MESRYVKETGSLGMKKRLLNKEDFNDDKKDAGELGSEHTVMLCMKLFLQGQLKMYHLW